MVELKDHKCTIDDIEWSGKYCIGGLGETVEREGKCKTCGKVYREVYIFSCWIDNQTEEPADL